MRSFPFPPSRKVISFPDIEFFFIWSAININITRYIIIHINAVVIIIVIGIIIIVIVLNITIIFKNT